MNKEDYELILNNIDFKEDFDNIVTDLCNKEFLKRGYNNQKIRFAMPLTRQAAILAIKYKISFD